jgi:CheY-like chemotaxis protein
LGFEVFEAMDGGDALDNAKECHPDVILMDLMMPGLNGFEATRQIRRLSELNDIVVFGISASVSSQIYEESIAAGCDGFLAKPVDVETLLEHLQEHLKLEWIYKEGRPHLITPIIPLPKKELAMLYDLVKSGDISSIRDQIPKIAELDPKFVPFADRLEQFARAFEMNGMKKFLETYMEVDP